jgi:multidrug efflux system outer membrane protein
MREFMKNLTIVAAVLGVSTGAAAVAAPAAEIAANDTLRLDLDTCLARAAATAPVLQAATATIDEAAAIAHEARARTLPVLGAGGAYQYTTEHMQKQVTMGPALPALSLEFGDGHVADLNLGLALPVYTGGELSHAVAAAAAGSRAAALREDSARLDLSRNVRQSFCAAMARRDQLQATELAVTRLRRHLATVVDARKAGAATDEACLRAEVRLNQAAQRRRLAAAASDSAGLVLGRLVGTAGTVVSPLGDAAATLLPAAGDTATTMRADLAALAAESDRQRELAAAARGRLLPRVLADVRAHYARPGVDLLANEWMGYGTVGVSVDWPLWDGGARTARSGQASARARWLEAQQRDLTEAVATAAATAGSALAAACDQEAQAVERARLQARLLEMVEGRYAQQAATETEYLDAQDELTQAELELALARARVRLAETALLWTRGR